MSTGNLPARSRNMMTSSLTQDADGQGATDPLSFGILCHQEHAVPHHSFRPEVLADGKYAQVHTVQPQVNVCSSVHSKSQVEAYAASPACFRSLPFTMSEAHAQVVPAKVMPAPSMIGRPVWPPAVPEPDSRHLPAEVIGNLTSQYSTDIEQMPPPATPLVSAPVPQTEGLGHPMDLQQEHHQQQRQSRPDERVSRGLTQLTELTQVSPTTEQHDHPVSASDLPVVAPAPPQSRPDAISSAGATPGPSQDPVPTAVAPCAAGLSPSPRLVTTGNVLPATNAAPTPVPAGTGYLKAENQAVPPPADNLLPAKADTEGMKEEAASDGSLKEVDAEDTPEEAEKPGQQPGARVESLTVTCDPETYSLSGGTTSSQDPAATDTDRVVLITDKAAAMEDGTAVPLPSEETTAGVAAVSDAGKLPTIGSVLLSGDRLVFCCALCPELFGSAGRLRTHHGLRHTPQQSPSETPPAPTAVRRRGRPPRSAATAASAVTAAIADGADSPDVSDTITEAENAILGLRRTRSGRTRVSPTPVSLRCEICGKVLSSANKLAVHQRMHSGERPHVCTYCPKRCNDLGNLRKHEQLHFKSRPFRCATCGITFWTALRQRAHRCKLAPASATRRPAAASTDGDDVDMAENGQETAPEGEAESQEAATELAEGGLDLDPTLGGLPALAAAAELTGARPKREPSPEREPNVNSGLVPVVPVDCDVCGRRLRSISGWQRHRRLHAGVRPYQCRFCDKTCNDSGNMRKHEAGHFKERPYRCDTCRITFINAWRLGLHQCKLRTDGGVAAAADGGAAPVPAAAAAEVEVEAALESRQPLPVPPPRGRHAPTPQLDARGRRRDHVCPVCNKALLSYASLEMHYRTHTGEKPYQCDECGKRFSIQGNLVVHTRIHTGERPFQCEECGKMFMYQSHLKVHKRGHSGARPYCCQFCHKGFAASSSRRVHEETVHSNERKFICETCGVAFKEKKHLKRHSLKKHQMGEGMAM